MIDRTVPITSPSRVTANPARGCSQRGFVMLLVLVAMAVAFVIWLVFLATSSSTTGTARLMAQHAQARQIAESGLTIATRYVQGASDWRTTHPPGNWVEQMSLLGGEASITAKFDAATSTQPVLLSDASFEQATGSLPNPVLAPPMSGVIGGWEVSRQSPIAMGLTVPTMGIAADPNATDGSNVASIGFTVSVNGTGTFAQTLADELQPRMIYEVAVDIASAGIPILNSSFGFRVLAGGSVIASTEHAWVFNGEGVELQLPQQVPSLPELPSALMVVGIGAGFSEYTLRFASGDAPEPGPLRLELFARSTGLAMEVRFDRLRFVMTPDDQLVLTSVGRYQDACHIASATLSAGSNPRIVQWIEP